MFHQQKWEEQETQWELDQDELKIQEAKLFMYHSWMSWQQELDSLEHAHNTTPPPFIFLEMLIIMNLILKK